MVFDSPNLFSLYDRVSRPPDLRSSSPVVPTKEDSWHSLLYKVRKTKSKTIKWPLETETNICIVGLEPEVEVDDKGHT